MNDSQAMLRNVQNHHKSFQFSRKHRKMTDTGGDDRINDLVRRLRRHGNRNSVMRTPKHLLRDHSPILKGTTYVYCVMHRCCERYGARGWEGTGEGVITPALLSLFSLLIHRQGCQLNDHVDAARQLFYNADDGRCAPTKRGVIGSRGVPFHLLELN